MSAGAEQPRENTRDPLKLEGKVPQVRLPDKGNDPERMRHKLVSELVQKTALSFLLLSRPNEGTGPPDFRRIMNFLMRGEMSG